MTKEKKIALKALRAKAEALETECAQYLDNMLAAASSHGRGSKEHCDAMYVFNHVNEILRFTYCQMTSLEKRDEA